MEQLTNDERSGLLQVGLGQLTDDGIQRIADWIGEGKPVLLTGVVAKDEDGISLF